MSRYGAGVSSSGEEPQERSDQRHVIWGALAGLVVVAIVIAALGSPLLGLIPIAIVAVALLVFFGGLS